MSTVEAFNAMLKNFLEELAEVFPEETQIRMFLAGFDAVVLLTPRGPLESFVDALAPHAALATAKDPSMFSKIQFPGGIDFAKLWARDDVSDNTRDAIWQYINLLFFLGSTVRNMSPEILQSIESVASQLQSGQLDMSKLLEGAGKLDMSALGGMLMGGFGGGGGGEDEEDCDNADGGTCAAPSAAASGRRPSKRDGRGRRPSRK